MSFIKQFVNRIFYPNKCNTERYVKYLRSIGAKIGDGTRFIAPKITSFDENRAEYISIGKNCCITKCTIMAHDYSWYVFKDAFGDVLPDAGERVIIGDNCFIGYESIILKGTEIGNNVIIGAGAVVKGRVPSNTVWGGVPARQICTLQKLYEKKVDTRVEDAFYRYSIVNETRQPSIEDMGMFAVLFLPRTDENYKRYIAGIEFNGIKDSDSIKHYFFTTPQMFENFDAFVKAYKNRKSGLTWKG